MTNGSRRSGRVVGVDDKFYRLLVTLAPGSPPATVSVQRGDVSSIDFAQDPARDRILARPAPSDLLQLAEYWKSLQPFLAVPKSPAGPVGRTYAGLLLASGVPGNAETALGIFSQIERDTWDEADRTAAREGRLRTMIATGRANEAVEEAKKIAGLSEDPAVLIEAKFILASAAHGQLKKLEEDNPRWDQDIYIRPERARLYNEALDLYLYPALFFGSEIEPAARGLSGALEVYRFGGDTANAVETARDLVTLYPATSYAKAAGEYLASVPPDQLPAEPEKEDGREPGTDSQKNKPQNAKSKT